MTITASTRTLTSANSVYALTAEGVFSAQKLEGYSADDGFSSEAIDLAEVVMGIDGFMSAGYTPNPIKQSITLMAASPSIDLFDQIIQTLQKKREILWLSAVITLPATGKVYNLSKGILNKGQIMPEAKKTLQPQKYEITWGEVTLQGAN